jgi:2-oxopent-4-enoate/cis-2-oxohex-4-enoate hydratase
LSSGEAGVERGMKAQLALLRDTLARGETRGGWKVGLNVPAVQQHLGIEQPVVGHLTSATRLDPGATVAIGGFTNAGLEPEIAATIGPGGEVAAIAAAIEIVDIDMPFDDVEPIVAANVFHRGWVTGPARDPGDVELGDMTAVVMRAGSVEHEASVIEAMGELDAVLAGVAARAGQAGDSLQGGDVVICGSLTPILPVQPGDQVEVRFGPLGSIGLSFT